MGRSIKNKTFFYAWLAGIQVSQSGSEGLYRVPTEANLRGDFSDDPRQIYNPFTTRPNPSGTGQFIRDPFPGNIIPTNLLNQGMLTFARTMLPAPINTGVPNRNARDTTPFVQDQNEWTFKIDQTLGDNDQVWFRYSAFDLDQSQFCAAHVLCFNNLGERAGKNWAVSWVRTFSPTTVLQAQYGRVHVRYDDYSGSSMLPQISTSRWASQTPSRGTSTPRIRRSFPTSP